MRNLLLTNKRRQWHPESCSYTQSNHLWFLVLTKKNTLCLSWLCGGRASWDSVIYLLCLSAVLIAWGAWPVTTVKAQLLCCSQRIRYPLFDRHSICGNYFLSLSLFFFSEPLSWRSVFVSKSKLCDKQDYPILRKRASSCNLSPNCRLDWFHFILPHAVLSR